MGSPFLAPDALLARLDAMGVPEASRSPIAAWLDLLRQWNQRIDLTAARSDDELLD